ncbi:MAG: ABC transporter permease [Phycisphaerales bacterium]|nr:ABC transporter permease [Phycisphaerales bacterium]
MTRLVLRRLLQLPLILLAVYTLTFVLVWLIPGSPLEKSEARQPPPEVVEAMQQQYQLDNPWSFYWDYLGNATGVSWVMGDHSGPVFDLGPSLRHENWTVNEILAAQLPVSMTLGLLAMAMACLIGITTGVLAAARPGSWLDLLSLLIALIGISLPAFVTGTALLLVGGLWLDWFPVSGWGQPQHMVLPALALSLPFAAYIGRLTRAGMLEQMASDHVRTLRAAGLPERTILLRHALRNAFLPVLSYLGPATAAAMTGSFVIERVFAVPGVGNHFIEAVLSKDITLIMGVVLVYSALLVLFNLVVDFLYGWFDPRIRLA